MRSTVIWLFVILCLIASSFISIPGNWRAASNPPLSGISPDTAASWDVSELEIKDGRFVGLALSGGGSRAANFSAAVMLELERLGILQQVDVISAVSGGTFPAAYYALGPTKAGPFTREQILKVFGTNFEANFKSRIYYPNNLLKLAFTDFTLSDIMDDVLNAHLFHHATFQDLPRHPKLLLNATSFGSHLRFVFTDSAFRELRSSLASFEIASAARTSASFPGAFESVMLKRHGTEPARVLLLYDGGAFDNFGVQSILEFLTRASRGTSLDVLFPKGCVIIVVDASANPHFEGDYAGLSPHGGLTGAFGKRIANAMDAMEIISERDRMAFLRAQGISDDELLGHAVISGLKPCSCHVVHLALRHLLSRKSDDDPSFERRVTRIPTALWIDNEGRADLFAAASVLVRELEESKLFSANLKTSCRTPEAAR